MDLLSMMVARKFLGGGGSSGGSFSTHENEAGGLTYKVKVGDVSEGCGAELNIAYGDTAPDDTSKLWVKTSEPSGVIVSEDIEYEGNLTESIEELSETLPDTSTGIVSASYGNKIYLIGGSYSKTSIRCFDTTTEQLETLSETTPLNVDKQSYAVVGDKVYLFGGPAGGYDENFFYFDMATEKCTVMQNMPSKRSGAGCAAVGTNIYLFGGYDGNGGYTNEIRCYDTVQNAFTTVPTLLPEKMYSCYSASIGTKVYIFGGYGNSNNYFDSILVFDSEKQTIESLPITLPAKTSSISCVAFGDVIYLFGGYATSAATDKIFKFDPLTESLITLECKLPSAASGLSSVLNDSKIYIFGVGKICVFSPLLFDYLVKTNELHIIPASVNAFCLINTDKAKVEIGVVKVYKGNADGHGEHVEAAIYKDGAWTNI